MLLRPLPIVLLCAALIGAITLIVWRTGSLGFSRERAVLTSTGAHNVIIEPYDIYEECLTLRSKETLHYSFETSAQVYFNIHYHDDQDEAFYPVPDYLSSGATAPFSPKLEAYYCLMWTNPTNEALELSFHHAK